MPSRSEPLFEQAASLVNRGGLFHELRHALGSILVAQLLGHGEKLILRFGAARTQQLVHAHDCSLRHVHELSPTLEVRGQRASSGGAGDLRLLAQCSGGDAQVLDRDAVLQQSLERNLIEALAALSAHDVATPLRQRVVCDRQALLAHAALPRKATSTSSGTAPSDVNSVSMA